MVRTRKGAKRISPKSSKDEPPDIENKKPKLESCIQSKYFNPENINIHASNQTADTDENDTTDSNETSDSLFRNKSKTAKKIEEESDSDGSSSDEFMKAPISLDDLGSFETLSKKAITQTTENKSVLSSTVSRLSDDDSDDGKESNVQEFYDFSQIIKSQELIMNTKKEQEEKCQEVKDTLSSKNSKHKYTKSTRKTKNAVKPDLKLLGEELGVSELLAIAEGTTAGVTKDESEDSESDLDSEKIKTEDNYCVPKEGVQVTIELPNVNYMKKKKGVDVEAALKRRINLIKKENQVFIHKVHTLCWIAHGIFLNRCVNNNILMGLALSLIPSNYCYPKKHMDLRYLEKLVEWFVAKVVFVKDKKTCSQTSNLSLVKTLELQINIKQASSVRDLVLIFVCILRSLGINVRLVINFRTVPIRPAVTDLCSMSNKPKEDYSSYPKKSTSPSKTGPSNGSTDKTSSKKPKTVWNRKIVKNISEPENEIKSPYFSSSDDLPLSEIARRKTPGGPYSKDALNKVSNSTISSRTNSRKTISGEASKSTEVSEKKLKGKRKSAPASFQEYTSSSEDEVFQKHKEIHKKASKSSKTVHSKEVKTKGGRKSNHKVDETEFKSPKATTSKTKDRRILSTDDDDDVRLNRIGNDYWAEVFVEEEEKWISVDLLKGKVHCINQLYKKATQPVRYVLAWNNNGSIKDVTRRYAPQWLTVTRKLRADDNWWCETMSPYTPPRTAREREEDEDLDRQLHDQPLPSSIADYKNHPLFALKRHLLKFQAIYPPDAPPVGFIKDEAVYSRGCVVELHTRETWIKEAKLVRRGEEPYKIVKARPKYDKLSGARLNDLPLPLFGFWQVEDYIPPPAVDGKVPRNEYGNVELYKPCMLPPGTVHLQVPGLARVARKLDIDCAPAVVGWEFSGGGSHPVLDGFIVCEEFRDILLDAWNKEIDESAKRAREKMEQRVYGNWKRLIKGLLIRERLKVRYDFGETEKESDKNKKKQEESGKASDKNKKKHQPKPGTSRS